MAKQEHHFLTTERWGRCTFLLALPGQTLKGKKVLYGLTVKGKETFRKSFPLGSIFATTSLHKIHKGRSDVYKVDDLFFLGEEGICKKAEQEAIRQTLIQEYNIFIQNNENN